MIPGWLSIRVRDSPPVDKPLPVEYWGEFQDGADQIVYPATTGLLFSKFSVGNVRTKGWAGLDANYLQRYRLRMYQGSVYGSLLVDRFQTPPPWDQCDRPEWEWWRTEARFASCAPPAAGGFAQVARPASGAWNQSSDVDT